MVHFALLLPPLPVESVRRDEMGLRCGALAGEVGLEVGEVRGQVDIGGEGSLEGAVGGGDGGVGRVG